jgi:hypothetical protein
MRWYRMFEHTPKELVEKAVKLMNEGYSGHQIAVRTGICSAQQKKMRVWQNSAEY